jgi:ribosomal protein S18 acetylase RimI-like enzyme
MVEVREAKLDDMETLCEIHRKDGLQHPKPLEAYPLMDWIVADSHVFLVATMKERPVGFILVRPLGSEARIDMMSVQENFQNKGIERQLLSTAESMLEVSEMKAYAPKDSGLVDIYRKAGYATKDETPNLYGQGKSGLLMVKDLTSVSMAPRKKRSCRKAPGFPEPLKKTKAFSQEARPAQKPEPKVKVLKPKSVYKTRAQQLAENLGRLDEAHEEEDETE